MFPNAKEITESFAAFDACKYLGVKQKERICIVCVGDGHKPRTAALCAFMSCWECYSIDPEMNKTDFPVKRLTCFNKKIEDVQLNLDCRTVILCVHSHAKLSVCLENIKAPRRDLVSIPCCFPDNLSDIDTTFRDDNIWSEKNRVNIYCDI